MKSYLVGYTFGIIWEGETNISEYTIVEGESDILNKQVGVNTDFAKSLLNHVAGETIVFISNKIINKYVLKYVVCPKFSEVCKQRNIKSLYHFTAIENLNSILKYGLLSISELKKNNISYIYNDEYRMDGNPDFISCSVEFPNGQMLNYCKNKYHRKYVLLEIDINVLNYKFSKCCQTNAAVYNGLYIEGIDKFYKLFENYRFESLPNNFPTDEQAEVIVKKAIEASYIKTIIFETDLDRKLFNISYDCVVNPEMFNYRSEYLHFKTKFKTKHF